MSTTGQGPLQAGHQRQDRVPEVVGEEVAAALPSIEAPASSKKVNPARKVGGVVLLVILCSLGWHVASDLMAPSSSTGSVAAFTTQVAPRVGGQVALVHVNDNQEVRAGEPLFSLDPAPFELTLRQAEAA